MRTAAPTLLPLFRSEMQVRLLALLLLQPDRSWTLQQLAEIVAAPQSSVHRELKRAEGAGLILQDTAGRPHRFSGATDDSLADALATLLERSVGVEEQLRAALERPDVSAAVIHGSWASGKRRPESDIDVLVVGDAALRELRRLLRPIGRAAGRTIDLTVMTADEFRALVADRSSFVRRVLEDSTTPLVGDLTDIAAA